MMKLNSYEYDKCVNVLCNLDTEKQKYKMVYHWVKSNFIGFIEFRSLLFYCN